MERNSQRPASPAPKATTRLSLARLVLDRLLDVRMANLLAHMPASASTPAINGTERGAMKLGEIATQAASARPVSATVRLMSAVSSNDPHW